ncbi:MAG TPA: hypothetical protein VEG32_07685 [Clostridia bacterium]|nr:hypothetical protein [Clostridia bacterium]
MTFYHQPSNSTHSRAYLIVTHAVFGLLLAGSLALIFGAVVMWLWNGVMPKVLPAREITYWQSVSLLVLTRVLVGGLGHGRHGHTRRPHGQAWRQYDEWWREVGQHSFREFSNNPQADRSGI